MPETPQYLFPYKELTTVLLKQQAIHEGLWTIVFEFAVTGGAIPFPPLGNNVFIPGAILGIPKIGIQRVDAATPLTVDAAEVNPATPPVAPES